VLPFSAPPGFSLAAGGSVTGARLPFSDYGNVGVMSPMFPDWQNARAKAP